MQIKIRIEAFNLELLAETIALETAREMLLAEAATAPARSGKLMIRQLDRISAITGVPWETVNREAEKEGLV